MSLTKKILLSVNTILLFLLIYVGLHIIKSGDRAKIYKSDYAILHSVEYGMFNSYLWTMKIAKVIDHKIDNFNINTENREEIKGYIETIIDTLIVEADRLVRDRNTHKRGFLKSIVGSTKQIITDSVIDIKSLRKRVPEITDTVMLEVEKPENQELAKTIVRDKLREFMGTQFKPTADMTIYNAVLQKYHVSDPDVCNSILKSKMQHISKIMRGQMMIMLLLAGTIILLTLLHGTLNSISLFLLSGTTVSLLISGIMLPMLDIEAKIAKLYFTILDQAIVFENQILFFQSKSISDLVKLLIESDEVKMIFVGILLVMFSIIFPTLKLISTYMYYYSSSIIGNNPVTRFFAIRSTKWSMADVMVVSIFMSYLGLDGVVNNELRRIEGQTTLMNIITTNGTHLEVGFFLFLGFVTCSFVLALMVESKRNKDQVC